MIKNFALLFQYIKEVLVVLLSSEAANVDLEATDLREPGVVIVVHLEAKADGLCLARCLWSACWNKLDGAVFKQETKLPIFT